MSKVLTAADVFAAKDLAEDLVPVPEWGGDIKLKQMNAAETMAMTKDMEANKGDGMFIILVHTARAEDDSHLFTHEQIDRLREKNFNILNFLQRKALSLNRMGGVETVALKKDSSEAVTGDSPTASPKN